MNFFLPSYAPMLAKPCARLPSQTDDFAVEVKWDGIRAIVYIEAGIARIISRNGCDITFRYPELQLLAQAVGRHALILDGEIVAFNEAGTPSFSLLQQRMNLEKPVMIQRALSHVPISFIVFDLLQVDKNSLIDESYLVRRQILDDYHLCGKYWITPPYRTGNVEDFLSASQELGLEGIILKRSNSPYMPGKRSDSWLKVKNYHRQEFIIGGWTPGKGKRSGTIGALLLGYYSQEHSGKSEPKLLYAGSCGTGFTEKTLSQLKELFMPLAISYCPFATDPLKSGANFIKPVVVAEVSFTEWTQAQTLRHPSFLGLRSDKLASAVTKEAAIIRKEAD